MRIVINHDNCGHSGEYADRCLAASLRNPYGREAFCSAQTIQDGRREITVDLILDGKKYTRVFESETEREIAADEGWQAFVRQGSAAG